jgi:hypothetical protein
MGPESLVGEHPGAKMTVKSTETSYASFTAPRALALLTVLAGFTLFCLVRAGDVGSLDIGRLDNELDDSLLFSAVASRVHAGEGYYDASAVELAARGYATDSVFNWRLPTYAWIYGRLPSQGWGWFALDCCTLLAAYVASHCVAGEHGLALQFAAALAFASAEAWVIFPEPIYFTELWAGIFIFISLGCFFHGRWALGVVAGALALSLRELALPFCAAMLSLSCWRRRSREMAAWLVVLTLYSALFYFHYLAVTSRGASRSLSHDLKWVAFGGVTSVLSMCRMNFVLAVLPAWVTALYLPLALLGIMGWNHGGAVSMKLTVPMYLAMFAVIGRPFNFYWGWLFAPSLAMGIVWAPMALRDLAFCLVRAKVPQPTR